jgi:hypothetical protein
MSEKISECVRTYIEISKEFLREPSHVWEVTDCYLYEVMQPNDTICVSIVCVRCGEKRDGIYGVEDMDLERMGTRAFCRKKKKVDA